jgi:hypothetical protein
MTKRETRYASQLIHELAIAREQVIALSDENRRLRSKFQPLHRSRSVIPFSVSTHPVLNPQPKG